jgi:hypothetical protein
MVSTVVKYARSADKHGVPRRSTWFVVMTKPGIPTTTNKGENGTYYEGRDNRDVELEVVTVPVGLDELVIHSMPTSFRHQEGDAQ